MQSLRRIQKSNLVRRRLTVGVPHTYTIRLPTNTLLASIRKGPLEPKAYSTCCSATSLNDKKSCLPYFGSVKLTKRITYSARTFARMNGTKATPGTGYTASDAFFEALGEAGVRYCFVNLGSDHPSILEAMAKGQKDKKKNFPMMITCPNEMVCLAMADGYARLTNRPQAIVIHVDVGTQGLGAAVHDASMGRSPVLIFAGLSPVTIEGEQRGSRTEYIHWIQDVPDQKAIISQYCNYTGEIKNSRNVKQMVNRALSFAMSDPKGPVHLVGAREVMEEEITPYSLNQDFWKPIEPAALSADSVSEISDALVHAKEPLVIVGMTGRNHATVPELVKLANTVKGLRVLDTAGSDMSFPADHPGWLGLRYGVDESIKTADVILLLDTDTPWIPTLCKPKDDARVYHVDVDPLKNRMPTFYLNNVIRRCRADCLTALRQLNARIAETPSLQETINSEEYQSRWTALQKSHADKLNAIAEAAKPSPDGTYGPSYLIHLLRKSVPKDTIFVVEAVTLTAHVADQLQATIPGSYINCLGGGLGWSGGASLGIKLASQSPDSPYPNKKPLVVQIVGDGTFLFSVPGSVYWIAQRYQLPTLTIVLNNKGWNAPRRSALLVHPEGHASKMTNEELHISFAPSPDYAGIAKAASGGKMWAAHASTAKELEDLLPKAVESVESGIGAVIDCHLEGKEGKYAGNHEGTSLS